MSAGVPPRWLEALLRLGGSGLTSGDSMVGDMAEGYAALRARSGAPRATLWYAWQVVTVALHVANPALRGGSRHGGGPLEPLGWDLRFTVRSMVLRPWPGFAVVAILALSIGANTAAVSLLTGTYRAATWWSGGDAVVSLWPDQGMSLGQLLTVRQEQQALGEVGAWLAGTSSVEDDANGARSVASVRMSPNLFAALSVTPTVGSDRLPARA